MDTLIHFKLCPFSRSIRLALAERGVDVLLADEPVWEWRREFLAINPAGELPVLQPSDGAAICGAYAISEFLDDGVREGGGNADRKPMMLFPEPAEARAEVRRLVDWFHGKFDREVTRDLLAEKVFPRLSQEATRPPDAEVLRAAGANLRYHLSYVGFLAEQRSWLAGDELSFADLAAAAQISVADYLGMVPWELNASARSWYARVKSRPSFRPLLADRVPGLHPPAHYGDLDF